MAWVRMSLEAHEERREGRQQGPLQGLLLALSAQGNEVNIVIILMLVSTTISQTRVVLQCVDDSLSGRSQTSINNASASFPRQSDERCRC